MNHRLVFLVVSDKPAEVCEPLDLTAQVVAAVDMVAQVGEAVQTHVGLCMSQDVGITGTSEGVEETAVIEVHTGVAQNQSVVAATIDKLHVSHLLRRVISA